MVCAVASKTSLEVLPLRAI